jgi:HEPN domain-containing protein
VLRRDFQKLSVVRVREARILLQAHLYDGACHLGGLAVENALKACIARATLRREFPDRPRANRAYTHDLEGLLREAGLESRLTSAMPAVKSAWARAKDWQVDGRYELAKSQTEAMEFLQAIAGRQGVLPWLRQYW